jgi:hypothetical protein
MAISRAVWIIPIVLVLTALFPLPYGYYVFLRIVLFLAGGFLAWREYRERQGVTAWLVGLVILVVVYNPISPIHLTREIWSGLNVATAFFLGAHMRYWLFAAAKNTENQYRSTRRNS